MINPVNTSVLTANHKVAQGSKLAVDKPDVKNSALHQIDDKSDKASVSILARQLAESAVRAEARDKDMSREQLRAYAMRMFDKVSVSSEPEHMARRAAELPDTDDPELLERARQATSYLFSVCRGDTSAKNPFAGLTREQAALIAYDDAGPYTKNERRAAIRLGSELEQQWRVGLFARSYEESREFGTSVGFYTECLVHHKSLPLIEQVQYGGLEYEARLGRLIAEEVEGLEPTDRLLTLFEVLARMGFPELKKKYEKQPADEAVQAARKAMTAPAATSPEAKPKQPAAQKSTSITEPTTLKTSSLSPDVFPSPVAVERSQPCRVAR
jgi:hypothetical protein